MASKNNEFQVDDLLNNLDNGNSKKGGKDVKKVKQNNGWDEGEDDNAPSLGFANSQQTTKAKAPKKKGGDKGWGDLQQEPQPVKTTDFESIQNTQEKKTKIFNKPTGQTKAPKKVDVDEEYFPSLGEEAPQRPPPKRPEPVVESPVIPVSQGGPKRFQNAKKQGAGESFAPLDPNLSEKPVPVHVPAPVTTATPATTTATTTASTTATTITTSAPVTTTNTEATSQPSSATQVERKPGESGFVRRQLTSETAPQEVPADSKFKFGGEGPRKFVGGGKISFVREEEKNEQENLRLQKERQVEEQLAKEREEAEKQREFRDLKKTRPAEGEQGEPKTEEESHEERKPARFVNTKKDTSKPTTNGKAPVVAPPVEAPVQEPVDLKPKESIEMNGALTNKGWGEGPILKKAQKK